MILRFPTGFYAEVLPQKPEDRGNVTFTVSNSDPPRARLLFTKIPTGLASRPRPDRVYSDAERAAVFSKLAHSSSRASPSVLASGSKQFEAGQTIEFGTQGTVPTLTPMLVAPATEIRHDTNLLDLTSLGVAADDQDAVGTAAYSLYKTLSARLNAIVQERTDTETALTTTQKLLNETNKALASLAVLIAESPSTDGSLVEIQTTLTAKRTALEAQKTELVAQANALAAEATATQDKLVQLSQLVR